MNGPGAQGPWLLGVDSGGSGLRVALGRTPGPGWGGLADVETVAVREFDEPVPLGPGGIDADRLLQQVVRAVRELSAEVAEGTTGRRAPADLVAAVGAAGMASLGGELRAVLPRALRAELGVRRLALASDAVTAYAGAAGQRAGAVVAAGTGMVALGTDLARWRRVDGWGHLLGDCGSGAWIGRAGLEAALRAHDGRRGGSGALLRRAEPAFGPPAGMPGVLYPRPDRAAVLASFAPEVARCAAEDGDLVAAGILAEAAGHLADSAAAAHPPGGGGVALTGGLFRIGEPLLAPVRRALAERLPGMPVREGVRDPLSGALLLAGALAAGALRLPREEGLLDTYEG
ncbi:ATPase [Streptomyces sp. CC53]|uniref:BadF/BadG/BcrA/BcrD ATPase family protein n=1 Tax=unclassified Streptomyces TaxID=2593676 RepID=UPI0008DC9F57|nr:MULTISPECIES: BadF/BadG/BcrA/BcrD ATPase family protein [unclassified Streptomyces]OII65680.1 ATPase [Streptomyces sp. CC53]